MGDRGFKIMSDLYEQDFYGWTQEQAVLLRQGQLKCSPQATA